MHGNELCAGSRELSTAFGPFVTQEDTVTDTCTAGHGCPSSACCGSQFTQLQPRAAELPKGQVGM